jgi:hypothetical protein
MSFCETCVKPRPNSHRTGPTYYTTAPLDYRHRFLFAPLLVLSAFQNWISLAEAPPSTTKVLIHTCTVHVTVLDVGENLPFHRNSLSPIAKENWPFRKYGLFQTLHLVVFSNWWEAVVTLIIA